MIGSRSIRTRNDGNQRLVWLRGTTAYPSGGGFILIGMPARHKRRKVELETEVLRVLASDSESCAAIRRAGALIRAGRLVAFPTETVYGLGANGFDRVACARIYEAKGRPSDNPLILHVAGRAMVEEAAAGIPPMAEKLMAAFMPGPLTLILPRKPLVPDRITGGLDTVGIRAPEHPVARALIRAAGVPIAAPSANRSGRPSPTTASSVLRDMEGRIPLILDGGTCRVGIESTIVDCTGAVATILRPGAITREMLTEVLGGCNLDPALVGAKTVPRAPGMKYRHYAPKADMTLYCGAPAKMAAAFRREVRRLLKEGRKPGVLASHETCSGVAGLLPESRVRDYGAQGDLSAIASHIYEGLIAFDATDADVLLAEGVAEGGLGLAIMNRLRKASGGRVRELA